MAELGTGCIVILRHGNYIDPEQLTVIIMNRFNDPSKVRIYDHPNSLMRLRWSVDPAYVRSVVMENGFDKACV